MYGVRVKHISHDCVGIAWVIRDKEALVSRLRNAHEVQKSGRHVEPLTSMTDTAAFLSTQLPLGSQALRHARDVSRCSSKSASRTSASSRSSRSAWWATASPTCATPGTPSTSSSSSAGAWPSDPSSTLHTKEQKTRSSHSSQPLLQSTKGIKALCHIPNPF